MYMYLRRELVQFLTLYTDICIFVRHCGPRFETEAVLTCDLITLTFDLSTSIWGHGPPVSWASFLPIFSFLRSSILD